MELEHAEGVFEHELNEFKSVAVTRIIHDFYDTDPKRGFYGGGGIDMRFDVYPMGYGFGGVFPPKTARWGAEYKKALSQYYTRCAFTFGHATSLAVENNSISLDPTAKDAWGLPLLRMTFDFRDNEDELDRLVNARSAVLRPIPSVHGHRAGNPISIPADRGFIHAEISALLQS